jgi:hypothetical protein
MLLPIGPTHLAEPHEEAAGHCSVMRLLSEFHDPKCLLLLRRVPLAAPAQRCIQPQSNISVGKI